MLMGSATGDEALLAAIIGSSADGHRAPDELRAGGPELLTEGQSTAEIASGLVITPGAVLARITAIVRKLHVPDRAAAVELFRGRA